MSTKKGTGKKNVRVRFNIEKVANGYTVDVSEEAGDRYESKTFIFDMAADVIGFLEGSLD